jgi:hypothetical protein
MKQRGTNSRRGSGPDGPDRRDRAITVDDVTDALARATRDAVERHKRLGQSICVWQDGRVVEIPASEIRVPPLR